MLLKAQSLFSETGVSLTANDGRIVSISQIDAKNYFQVHGVNDTVLWIKETISIALGDSLLPEEYSISLDPSGMIVDFRVLPE